MISKTCPQSDDFNKNCVIAAIFKKQQIPFIPSRNNGLYSDKIYYLHDKAICVKREDGTQSEKNFIINETQRNLGNMPILKV